ncbi:MAG TPA: hypothetical protein VHF06_25165 [Pseudonocardiaceae bacterium]|nr:hypothetical protein [Pseudonocardiaceae bacterium]
MLSRRYLAAAVLATGLVTAAVPAFAASPNPTNPANPTAAAPSRSAAPANPTSTTGAAPEKVIKLPDGNRCVITVDKSGKPTIVPKGRAQMSAVDRAECEKLMSVRLTKPYPKGAPQTGGGGMAAEVSSWR